MQQLDSSKRVGLVHMVLGIGSASCMWLLQATSCHPIAAARSARAGDPAVHHAQGPCKQSDLRCTCVAHLLHTQLSKQYIPHASYEHKLDYALS